MTHVWSCDTYCTLIYGCVGVVVPAIHFNNVSGDKCHFVKSSYYISAKMTEYVLTIDPPPPQLNKTAGYFWYETKSQVLHFVIF